jgi:hypothetical protein
MTNTDWIDGIQHSIYTSADRLIKNWRTCPRQEIIIRYGALSLLQELPPHQATERRNMAAYLGLGK